MGETPRAVPCTRQLIDLDNYKGAVAARLENAWEVAHAQVDDGTEVPEDNV